METTSFNGEESQTRTEGSGAYSEKSIESLTRPQRHTEITTVPSFMSRRKEKLTEDSCYIDLKNCLIKQECFVKLERIDDHYEGKSTALRNVTTQKRSYNSSFPDTSDSLRRKIWKQTEDSQLQPADNLDSSYRDVKIEVKDAEKSEEKKMRGTDALKGCMDESQSCWRNLQDNGDIRRPIDGHENPQPRSHIFLSVSPSFWNCEGSVREYEDKNTKVQDKTLYQTCAEKDSLDVSNNTWMSPTSFHGPLYTQTLSYPQTFTIDPFEMSVCSNLEQGKNFRSSPFTGHPDITKPIEELIVSELDKVKKPYSQGNIFNAHSFLSEDVQDKINLHDALHHSTDNHSHLNCSLNRSKDESPSLNEIAPSIVTPDSQTPISHAIHHNLDVVQRTVKGSKPAIDVPVKETDKLRHCLIGNSFLKAATDDMSNNPNDEQNSAYNLKAVTLDKEANDPHSSNDQFYSVANTPDCNFDTVYCRLDVQHCSMNNIDIPKQNTNHLYVNRSTAGDGHIRRKDDMQHERNHLYHLPTNGNPIKSHCNTWSDCGSFGSGNLTKYSSGNNRNNTDMKHIIRYPDALTHASFGQPNQTKLLEDKQRTITHPGALTPTTCKEGKGCSYYVHSVNTPFDKMKHTLSRDYGKYTPADGLRHDNYNDVQLSNSIANHAAMQTSHDASFTENDSNDSITCCNAVQHAISQLDGADTSKNSKETTRDHDAMPHAVKNNDYVFDARSGESDNNDNINDNGNGKVHQAVSFEDDVDNITTTEINGNQKNNNVIQHVASNSDYLIDDTSGESSITSNGEYKMQHEVKNLDHDDNSTSGGSNADDDIQHVASNSDYLSDETSGESIINSNSENNNTMQHKVKHLDHEHNPTSGESNADDDVQHVDNNPDYLSDDISEKSSLIDNSEYNNKMQHKANHLDHEDKSTSGERNADDDDVQHVVSNSDYFSDDISGRSRIIGNSEYNNKMQHSITSREVNADDDALHTVCSLYEGHFKGNCTNDSNNRGDIQQALGVSDSFNDSQYKRDESAGYLLQDAKTKKYKTADKVYGHLNNAETSYTRLVAQQGKHSSILSTFGNHSGIQNMHQIVKMTTGLPHILNETVYPERNTTNDIEVNGIPETTNMDCIANDGQVSDDTDVLVIDTDDNSQDTSEQFFSKKDETYTFENSSSHKGVSNRKCVNDKCSVDNQDLVSTVNSVSNDIDGESKLARILMSKSRILPIKERISGSVRNNFPTIPISSTRTLDDVYANRTSAFKRIIPKAQQTKVPQSSAGFSSIHLNSEKLLDSRALHNANDDVLTNQPFLGTTSYLSGHSYHDPSQNTPFSCNDAMKRLNTNRMIPPIFDSSTSQYNCDSRLSGRASQIPFRVSMKPVEIAFHEQNTNKYVSKEIDHSRLMSNRQSMAHENQILARRNDNNSYDRGPITGTELIRNASGELAGINSQNIAEQQNKTNSSMCIKNHNSRKHVRSPFTHESSKRDHGRQTLFDNLVPQENIRMRNNIIKPKPQYGCSSRQYFSSDTNVKQICSRSESNQDFEIDKYFIRPKKDDIARRYSRRCEILSESRNTQAAIANRLVEMNSNVGYQSGLNSIVHPPESPRSGPRTATSCARNDNSKHIGIQSERETAFSNLKGTTTPVYTGIYKVITKSFENPVKTLSSPSGFKLTENKQNEHLGHLNLPDNPKDARKYRKKEKDFCNPSLRAFKRQSSEQNREMHVINRSKIRGESSSLGKIANPGTGRYESGIQFDCLSNEDEKGNSYDRVATQKRLTSFPVLVINSYWSSQFAKGKSNCSPFEGIDFHKKYKNTELKMNNLGCAESTCNNGRFPVPSSTAPYKNTDIPRSLSDRTSETNQNVKTEPGLNSNSLTDGNVKRIKQQTATVHSCQFLGVNRENAQNIDGVHEVDEKAQQYKKALDGQPGYDANSIHLMAQKVTTTINVDMAPDDVDSIHNPSSDVHNSHISSNDVDNSYNSSDDVDNSHFSFDDVASSHHSLSDVDNSHISSDDVDSSHNSSDDEDNRRISSDDVNSSHISSNDVDNISNPSDDDLVGTSSETSTGINTHKRHTNIFKHIIYKCKRCHESFFKYIGMISNRICKHCSKKE